MDIFSFAYPTPSPSSLEEEEEEEEEDGEGILGKKGKRPAPVDLFMEIRSQLDIGYETIGVFQDLARR